MAIKLIALDIDGTLLNSRWEVSAVNQAAIAAATRRGIEVALVTGRRYDFAMLVARQIASPLTMIVNNGAMVKGADGKVTPWNFELGAIPVLLKQGWRKDSLKAGDQVTVEGSRAKDGSTTGNARSVKLPDGRRVFGGSSGGDSAPNQ